MFRNAIGDRELSELIKRFQNIAKSRFKKVAVLMGGESEEREISLKSGKAISGALTGKGYDVLEVDAVSPDLIDMIRRSDAVFLALHGRLGEDGTVQGMLEIMKIPYSSPDPVVSAFFMDKVMTRHIGFLKHPRYFVVDRATPINDAFRMAKGIGFPIVVKPSFSGSSLGVSVVRSEDELPDALQKAFSFSSRTILEEFLDGPELTVAIFQGEPLGVLEIAPKDDVIFSFDAKYKGSTEYIIPPKNVPPDICEYVLQISRRICSEFMVTGAVRADFKMKDDSAFFLEINTIPGMTERSLLPKIARWRGIEFDDLVEAILGTSSVKIRNR